MNTSTRILSEAKKNNFFKIFFLIGFGFCNCYFLFKTFSPTNLKIINNKIKEFLIKTLRGISSCDHNYQN